ARTTASTSKSVNRGVAAGTALAEERERVGIGTTDRRRKRCGEERHLLRRRCGTAPARSAERTIAAQPGRTVHSASGCAVAMVRSGQPMSVPSAHLEARRQAFETRLRGSKLELDVKNHAALVRSRHPPG